MGVDLILTGKYGVLNQQKLLNATSNNINNVNTEGYVRKETQTYTSCVDWGVGDTYTRRIYDQYVQRQMYSDSGSYNYYKAYASGMSTADSVLSDSTMSCANSMTNFFNELATAAGSPTSSANRQTALSKLGDVVQSYKTANDSLYDSLADANGKVSDDVNDVNSYTKAIANINNQIRSLSLSDNQTNNEIYMQMLDERDRLIGCLAEKVSVNVVEQNDGTYDVYMNSGMLLANGDSYATLSAENNTFDVTKRDVYLSYESVADGKSDTTHVQLAIDNIGGSLGGYLNSTKEIRNTMRELGKLSVAFSDALNEQNKAGFTLEDVAGGNLLNIKSVNGVSTDVNCGITATFNEGEGSKVQGYDFEVSFADGNLHVYKVGADEKKVEITSEIDAADIGASSVNLKDYGLTLTFGDTIDNLKGSTTVMYVQPTMMSASTTTTAISKPEDFAFASAVRTGTSANNYGNATISLTSCTKTGDDMGVSVDPTTKKPVFNADAPTQIKTDDAGNYVIYSSTGDILGRAPASSNGTNIFANAVTYDSVTGTFTTDAFDRGSGYPGYEVSVTGTVKENDTFNIEINAGGQADNSNGNALVSLRSATLTKTSGSSKETTLTEGYANLLADIGSSVTSATANTEAAKAKYDQTVQMYQSDAGVNLDEEATNLLMYQQSYSACAKIIEASNTIFQALIGAM